VTAGVAAVAAEAAGGVEGGTAGALAVAGAGAPAGIGADAAAAGAGKRYQVGVPLLHSMLRPWGSICDRWRYRLLLISEGTPTRDGGSLAVHDSGRRKYVRKYRRASK